MIDKIIRFFLRIVRMFHRHRSARTEDELIATPYVKCGYAQQIYQDKKERLG